MTTKESLIKWANGEAPASEVAPLCAELPDNIAVKCKEKNVPQDDVDIIKCFSAFVMMSGPPNYD